MSIDGHRVSSSEIRKLLTEGDFKTAEVFLGRPFSISGKVANGDKMGRTIGFPTANIGIKRRLSPVLGVYSVHVEHGSQTHIGVCNVGKRPTIGFFRQQLTFFQIDLNFDH